MPGKEESRQVGRLVSLPLFALVFAVGRIRGMKDDFFKIMMIRTSRGGQRRSI